MTNLSYSNLSQIPPSSHLTLRYVHQRRLSSYSIASQPWLRNNACRGGHSTSRNLPACQEQRQKTHNASVKNIPGRCFSPGCVPLTWIHKGNIKPNNGCQGTHLRTQLAVVRWKNNSAKPTGSLRLLKWNCESRKSSLGFFVWSSVRGLYLWKKKEWVIFLILGRWHLCLSLLCLSHTHRLQKSLQLCWALSLFDTDNM